MPRQRTGVAGGEFQLSARPLVVLRPPFSCANVRREPRTPDPRPVRPSIHSALSTTLSPPPHLSLYPPPGPPTTRRSLYRHSTHSTGTSSPHAASGTPVNAAVDIQHPARIATSDITHPERASCGHPLCSHISPAVGIRTAIYTHPTQLSFFFLFHNTTNDPQ